MNRIKKALCSLTATALLFAACFSSGLESQAQTKTTPTIRVELSSLCDKTSITLTVNGNYSITDILGASYSDKNDVLLSKGQYTVQLSGGVIYLISGSKKFALGTGFTLYSHTSGRKNYISTYNSYYARTCNYIGNIEFSISSGALHLINVLSIEDYLCGVVPYEMSNAQEVESLKTQAVCARSYAYIRVYNDPMEQGAHVTDKTNTQVYKGYEPSYTKCIAAVDQTAYQVLTYNGKIISTYYSASNGGITESNAGAWGSTALPYLKVKVDEYDLAYKDIEYTISKTNIYSKNVDNFKSSLKTNVQNMGYDFNTLEIVSIAALKPTYASEPASLPENQRRLIKLEYVLKLKAKKVGASTYTEFQSSVTKSREAIRTSIYFLRSDSGNYVRPMSTKISITEASDKFILKVSGNGHGIGMSQIGVYARVKAGQKYDQILMFYFDGTKITNMNYSSYVYKTLPSELGNDASTLRNYSKSYSGKISSTKSVDVYSGPGRLYSKSATLENGTFVNISAYSNDWYKVTSIDGSITGFVKKSFIEQIDKFPSSDITVVDEGVDYIKKVGTLTEKAWILADKNNTADFQLNYAEKGSNVYVISKEGEWYKIAYDNYVAYISASSVKLTNTSLNIECRGTANAVAVNVRSSSSMDSVKLGFITLGTTVNIYEIKDSFAKVQYCGFVGYIHTDYLDIENLFTDVTDEEISIAGTFDKYARVNQNVNIRDSYDGANDPVGILLVGDIVHLIGCEGDKYIIRYNNRPAYIPMDSVDINGIQIDVNYAQLITSTSIYIGASYNAKTIGKANAGDSLEIIEALGDWILVKFSGTIGYIHSSSAKVISDTLISPLKYTKGIVNADNVNVRASADVSSASSGVLQKGTSVEITDIFTGWYKIKYFDGSIQKTGFIISYFITIEN